MISTTTRYTTGKTKTTNISFHDMAMASIPASNAF
jgi:hypothetical protein